MNRRLILVISGVAAVVVVGLIILVTVILPSGSRQVEEPVIPPPGSHVEPDKGPPRQEVGDTGLCPQPATSETEPTESIVQEPPRKKALPEESISSDQEFFRGNKIAFASDRDGNPEIYVMKQSCLGF